MSLPLVLSAEELLALLQLGFPQIPPGKFQIEALSEKRMTFRMRTDDFDLRPGGTVSGPSIMMLADTATYLLLMAHLGPVVQAVTTSCHLDFLRRPVPGVLIAETELLKLGRRLAVMEARIRSNDKPDWVARASLTYSLPG